MKTIIGKIIAIIGCIMILGAIVYLFGMIHPSIGILVLGFILAILGSIIMDES